ncbi:MAG: hypothetical protein HFI53_11330 [Lachnospiraceae bacterium]|nr:hypothetical protein [Lachnospiraceae bacterium]
MIVRKSLLKLRRTPVRTILFFLLVGFTSALLSTGGGAGTPLICRNIRYRMRAWDSHTI